jgi:hypothetical protein
MRQTVSPLITRPSYHGVVARLRVAFLFLMQRPLRRTITGSLANKSNYSFMMNGVPHRVATTSTTSPSHNKMNVLMALKALLYYFFL